MSGRGGGIAGNPVLIGAATTLVVLVAVFLAYNANQGLPFVPTYNLKAEVPSAANLVRGNEVRIGGSRVGTVDAIQVKRLEDDTNIAVLDLQMERTVSPLEKDSTVLIRPKSALGLKYVEITRGRSREGYGDGDTIPLSASKPRPVEFDEFTNMFDDETREAMETNLDGFGTAFAGRGESINIAIGAFRPLLRDVIPLARNLADPDTNLRRFVHELSDAASIVAPAAETQAELFVNLDATFAALREVARPYIQDTISGGRAPLDAGIESFPVQRPFLANTEGLFRELQPGVRALSRNADELAAAFVAGQTTLRRAPALNRRLESLLAELQRFAEDPQVPRGIDGLTDVVRTLDPTLEHLAPAQIQCNYATLWFRNVSSLLSEGDRNGTWQRFIIIATPSGPNNEGGPASAPANGPNRENFLHTNPYPNTASPGQPKECEAANEPYVAGRQSIGNVSGKQSATTERTP